MDKNIDIRKTKEFLEYGFKIVTCPICQNETLDDFFICPHCGWEYDGCIKEDDYSSANKATVAEYRVEYYRAEYENLAKNAKEKSTAIKTQAWYEPLISDHFIEYVKSDPDYEKDFKDENSVINHFWDVIEGFTFGNIIREHPSKAKDAAKDIEGLGYGWWVLKGYWVYINDENNERDIGVIAKSIREKDETRSFYEHDLKELSEVQLAFLIMYSSWSRMGHPSNEYEFTISGDLKKYLLALKKRHEETVESAK